MPIIVPIEENHVGLASATDAKFRPGDYSGSGLEALGAGLAKVGAGGQQFASALDEKRRRALAAAIAAAHLDDDHQRNLDDAAAKKAYVDYGDQAAALLHGDDGILNHAGADAHTAFPTLVAALADSHDNAMASLDPIQRGAVAHALGDRLRGDVARAAVHVRQQGVVEQRSRSEALQKAAARDAVAHVDDPDLHDHHMATGENAIRQQARIANLPDKELERQLADYRSGVIADSIAVLAARAPARAVEWYAHVGGALNESDRSRVEATLLDAPGGVEANVVSGAGQATPPARDADGTIDNVIMNPPFDTDGRLPSDNSIDAGSDDASASDGQAYSANAAEADDENPVPASDGISTDDGVAASAEPIVAKGDGGAPMPIHMDMQPPRALGDWFARPARRDQYVIDTPPDFITRFRRNHRKR